MNTFVLSTLAIGICGLLALTLVAPAHAQRADHIAAEHIATIRGADGGMIRTGYTYDATTGAILDVWIDSASRTAVSVALYDERERTATTTLTSSDRGGYAQDTGNGAAGLTFQVRYER
jgi:hypothetical protein